MNAFLHAARYSDNAPDEKPKTCSNCKHWERTFETAYGECTNECVNAYSLSGDSDELLVEFSGESYALSFGENFGCIHFEQKE